MKLLILMVVVFLGAAPGGRAGEPDRVPFEVGERLVYQIFWGPFVVGRASLEVAAIEPVDGHDCYHLVGQAKTSGLTDLLFPVSSKTESWLDAQGLFTRKYRQDRREGDRCRRDETRYDYEHGESITENFITGKTERRPLSRPVQDVVSAVFYLRTTSLALRAERTMVVNADGKDYTVTVRPDQRRTLSVRPVGEVPALRLEPNPTLKIVAANKGRLWFWVSDDPRHLPLLVTSEMSIGIAKLVLFQINAPSSATNAARNFGTARLESPSPGPANPPARLAYDADNRTAARPVSDAAH